MLFLSACWRICSLDKDITHDWRGNRKCVWPELVSHLGSSSSTGWPGSPIEEILCVAILCKRLMFICFPYLNPLSLLQRPHLWLRLISIHGNSLRPLCCYSQKQILQLDCLRGEWGGKCLQRQLHLHYITVSQLWRRATKHFNRFGALAQQCVRFHCLKSAAQKGHTATRRNLIIFCWVFGLMSCAALSKSLTTSPNMLAE